MGLEDFHLKHVHARPEHGGSGLERRMVRLRYCLSLVDISPIWRRQCESFHSQVATEPSWDLSVRRWRAEQLRNTRRIQSQTKCIESYPRKWNSDAEYTARILHFNSSWRSENQPLTWSLFLLIRLPLLPINIIEMAEYLQLPTAS